MDIAQHGEEPYATGEGAILVSTEDGLESAVAVDQPIQLGHPNPCGEGPPP